jgi:O-antigen/teichoic acid export membrane protein
MLSRYYQDGTDTTYGFIIEKLALFTLLIGLPMALTLSLFATEIIVPLFGPNFEPTANVLRILVWYAAVNITANVFAQGLIVQNEQRGLLLIRAAGLGSNITLNALLIPRVGIIGAALASLVAELLVLFILTRKFQATGWDWSRILPRWLRLLALSAGVAAAMFVLGRIHPLLGLIGGPLLYAGGIMTGLVLAPDDWDLVYRLVAAMPGGKVILKYWRRDVTLNW